MLEILIPLVIGSVFGGVCLLKSCRRNRREKNLYVDRSRQPVRRRRVEQRIDILPDITVEMTEVQATEVQATEVQATEVQATETETETERLRGAFDLWREESSLSEYVHL